MADILVAYSTVDGHTLRICERLAELLRERGHAVRLWDIDDGGSIEVEPFDRIVIGASIRYGKHRQQVNDFIDSHLADLERKPSAFFSVNVVARKPEKSRPETNPYLQKFLKTITWQPQVLAVFAGKLDYPSYRFWDRLAIRLIMWMTKGPTDPTTVIEFTDWERVDEFGRQIAEL
jgi:menaquinone-dependent protoporphyrinogen oxidase